MLLAAVWYKLIAIVAKAVSESETSVSFYQATRGNIPKGSRLVINDDVVVVVGCDAA
jgi:hypothetical protein